MSSSLLSQFKADIALNLEGAHRRSLLLSDKADVKAKGSIGFRSGNFGPCSRSKFIGHGLYGNFSSKTNYDVPGKAEVVDANGIAAKMDAEKFNGGVKAYGKAGAAGIYGKSYVAGLYEKCIKAYEEANAAGIYKKGGGAYGEATAGAAITHQQCSDGDGASIKYVNHQVKDAYICMALGDNNDDDNESVLSLNFGNEERQDDILNGDGHVTVNPHGGGNGQDQEEPEIVKHAGFAVAKAGEVYATIGADIVKANDMLLTMNKPGHVIPEATIEQLKAILTRHVKVLLEGIVTREAGFTHALEQLSEAKDEVERLQQELEDSNNRIDRFESTTTGLSKVVQEQLGYMGFKNVEELIDHHIVLKDQVEVLKRAASIKSLSRAPSRVSVNLEETPRIQSKPKPMKDLFTSFSSNKTGLVNGRVQLPMPEKFKGKTRADLERFFKLYEAGTESRGWSDTDRAIYLGQYVPTMKLYHDSLSKRNASYLEMKQELANSLGSDSAAATFSLRSSLDRLKKPAGKLYKDFFEEVEVKVTEAFGADPVNCESELKKILIRLTEDDQDPAYSNLILSNAGETYYKLKHMVNSFESAQQVRKNASKPDKSKSFGSAYSTRQNHRDESKTSREEQGRNSGDKDNSIDRDENFKSSKDRGSYEKQEKIFDKKGENSGRAQDNKSCYTCKKAGHYSFECPEKQQGHSNVVSLDELFYCVSGIYPFEKAGADIAEDIPFFGKQCKMDVLFDGVKVNALLDSGACASVIKDTVVGKILTVNGLAKSGIREVKREAYDQKKLYGADGNRLKVVNCVTIPIAWGCYPTKLAKFFVVQGLSQDALIGTNILQEGKNWLGALSYVLQEKQNGEKGGDLNVIHLSSVNGGKNTERPSVAKVKKSTKDCQAGKEKQLNESRLGVATCGTDKAGSKTTGVAVSTCNHVIDAANPNFKRKESAYRKAQERQIFISDAKDFDRDRSTQSKRDRNFKKSIAGRTWYNSNVYGRAHQYQSIDRGICSDALESNSIIKRRIKATRDPNLKKSWSKKEAAEISKRTEHQVEKNKKYYS